MGVFQSWLDCFSVGVWAFIQNINFLSSVVFVYWCSFVTIFKCRNLSLITLFSKCIKLHQILSQFSTINLAQALGINIFGRDYSNLNNPILSNDVDLQYARLIIENRDNIWCNKKEWLFWHYIFKTNILPRIFFWFSAKRVLWPDVYIFNKFHKPDEVVT